MEHGKTYVKYKGRIRQYPDKTSARRGLLSKEGAEELRASHPEVRMAKHTGTLEHSREIERPVIFTVSEEVWTSGEDGEPTKVEVVREIHHFPPTASNEVVTLKDSLKEDGYIIRDWKALPRGASTLHKHLIRYHN